MNVQIICEPAKEEKHGTLRVQEEILKRVKGIKFRRTDFRSGMFNTLISFPLKVVIRSFGCDVNHFWHQNFAYVLCLFPFRHPIVTCYDIIYLKDKTLPLLQRMFNNLCIRGMKKAEKIITISEFSKKDIADTLRIDPSKITVAYPAYDRSLYNVKKTKIPAKYKIPSDREFILYVGSEQKRKNVDKILLALAKIKKKLPAILFVKIGKPHDPAGRDTLLKIIEKHKIKENVIFLDYVPEKDLPAFYNNAAVFVFPSSYEGFGLPVLEAMACGCPVITTKYSSLPEVGGDAVVYVEPENVTNITKSIEAEVKKNDINYNRNIKLRQTGKFDWKHSAKRIITEYYNVNNKKNC